MVVGNANTFARGITKSKDCLIGDIFIGEFE